MRKLLRKEEKKQARCKREGGAGEDHAAQLRAYGFDPKELRKQRYMYTVEPVCQDTHVLFSEVFTCTCICMYVRASIGLGVFLLKRCPRFRRCCAHASMELVPECLCPYSRGAPISVGVLYTL